MADWLNFAFVAVMWVIVVGRGVAMWHTRGHLLMWLALLSGIISITINQTPSLTNWITEQVGTPALAFVLDTVLALGAVTWVNTFFLEAAATGGQSPWLRRRWYSWYATLPVAVALTIIAFSGHLDIYSSYTAAGHHQATPHQLSMIILYEVYLLLNLWLMAFLFSSLARSETIPYMRWALRTLTLTSIGSGFRAMYTIVTIITPNGLLPWDTSLVLDLNMVSYFFGFIAITVLGVVQLVQQRWNRHRLRALLPLHAALRNVGLGHPGIQVEDDMPLEQALVARYTQIEDCRRWLQRYSTVDDLIRARQYVRSRWVLGGRRREAVAMAAWISLMLRRHEEGNRPQPRESGVNKVGTSTRLLKVRCRLAQFLAGRSPKASHISKDITRMARVSVAFDQHALVASFVEAHTARAEQSSSAR